MLKHSNAIIKVGALSCPIAWLIEFYLAFFMTLFHPNYIYFEQEILKVFIGQHRRKQTCLYVRTSKTIQKEKD